MTKYIEREAALSHPFANGHYDHEHTNEDFILGHEDYKEWLEQLPVADVAPVVHAHWVDVRQEGVCAWTAKCSNCWTRNDIPPVELAHYCPSCDAKMEVQDAQFIK